MKLATLGWLMTATAVLAVLADGVAQAEPVVDFTGGYVATTDADYSFGWAFKVNQTITVDALDSLFVTINSSGSNPEQVRLYNSSSLLASAIVSSADPTEFTPSGQEWYSHTIDSVTLTPGTYYIAEDIFILTTAVAFQTNAASIEPEVTYIGGVSSYSRGLDPTTDYYSGTYNDAYFGPNFDIQPAAVPEPTTLVPALTATVLGLAHVWRFRKRSA